MIPEAILTGSNSPAEKLVFDRLRDELSDDFTIIHSLAFHTKANAKSKIRSGEIDFLIIHPDRGWLVIEVKGGELEFNPNTNTWFSVDSHGNCHKIKDPYRQAQGNAHKLHNIMKEKRELHQFTHSFGYAVWFPEVSSAGRNLFTSAAQKMITLDSSAFVDVTKSILKLFQNVLGNTKTQTLGQAGVKTLTKNLVPSHKFTKKLSLSIELGEKQILQATQSQFKALSYLIYLKRALMSGPAGSGKTMILLEKACRFVEAWSERKVLILCYNRNLARMMRACTKNVPAIEVFNFHHFCEEIAERTATKFTRFEHFSSTEDKNYFDDYLPDVLLSALSNNSKVRYDAILVDEGQDFKEHWWIPIEEALADKQESLFYIFYDDNQNIYNDKRGCFPFNDPVIALVENCRNTKQIHQQAMQYYEGDINATPEGPDGKIPQVVVVKDDNDEKVKLEKLITKIVRDENVRPELITILTPRAKEKIHVEVRNQAWQFYALLG
jgi:hypothetical protein